MTSPVSSAGAAGEPGALLRAVFSVYKVLASPVLHAISPAQCKFLPTCSEYAYVAMARHGVVRGTVMALRRIARCRPFAAGGLDPVPPAECSRKANPNVYHGSSADEPKPEPACTVIPTAQTIDR